ncbi:MAG: GDP-mannose 4,6-dehydratase [Anaerolineae bacterium]|nr:GDP-mannose 4,6-dehydratase [Anaerolineae bacterium]
MRILVTGGTGFAGSFLVEQLLAEGHELFGLVHPSTSHQSLPEHPLFTPVEGDLLDGDFLTQLLQETRPQAIYHLAGQASPGLSWQKPALTLAVNAGGTATLLVAAAQLDPMPRVLVVTSAEIYGPIQPEMLPLTEATPPAPSHPYGVSKWAASQLVNLYWQRFGLPVIEARPFNHIGPRQMLGFVVPDFASQFAAMKLGQKPPVLSVGNLGAERDFTDVRDVVAAYQALMAQGKPGQSYLICSGQCTQIETIVDTLAQLAGVAVQIEPDPARMRPLDTPRLVGSYAKLHQDTGWRPQIPLHQSLADALDDWLIRLSNTQ